MAPLTWRNVDAPNFASSNDMFRIAAGLMNNGFDAARRGIGDFRDITTEDQSAALMQSIMNAGSPDAITAATTAANPAFLSPEALRFANAQPGVLLERQGAAQGIAQNNQTIRANDYNFDRGVIADQRADSQYEARKNANPIITEAYIAAEAGDWAKADQLFKNNIGLFGEAGIDSLATFQTLTSGRNAGRAEDQAAVAFENWNEGIANAKSAEDIVTLAGQNFGNLGKAEVLKQIQNLSGTGKFSDDVVSAALDRANGLDIWTTAPTNPLTGTAASLGIPVGPSGAKPDTAWANLPVAQTSNPVFNGFMGTVATQINNPYALAAIQATGEHESGFAADKAAGTWSDPSQSGQQGTSGGILSWREGRLRAMQEVGTTPEAQAQFFLQEDPELIQRLNNAGSVEEAQQLMNNAWKFAGYDQPGGEAAARLATARSLLPAYLNGETPTVGNAGPTRGNAAFMDQTGVNPLVSGSNNGVSDLLNAAANGSRQTVDPVRGINLSGSDQTVNPNRTDAPTSSDVNTELANSISSDIFSSIEKNATADAVQTNLDRTAEVPEPTVALPTPVVQSDPAPVDPFPVVDTSAPQYVQDQQAKQRTSSINNAIAELTSSTGGGFGSNITGGVQGFLDYYTQSADVAATNAATRDERNRAGDILAENADYFRQNPEQIAVAAADPVAYAETLAEKDVPASAPAGTPTATNQEDKPAVEQTPLERAMADREATLADPVAPSETVSDKSDPTKPNYVPLSSALQILSAQGIADQTTNIFGALDRMVANPPTEGTDPLTIINSLKETEFAGDDKVTKEQIRNAINQLVTDGITAPMAAEIIRHSNDNSGGWWPWKGESNINMDAALAIKDAFIGKKPDGSATTGAATRGLVRMAQVDFAISQVQNFQSKWQGVQDQLLASKAEVGVPGGITQEDYKSLAETAAVIEAEIRKQLLAIESTGLLSAYSNRQAN